jgi:plasmid maintenance system antidote protein VapI
MPADKAHKTMTELLREALAEADSIRAVARHNGLDHSSLVRFANGEQSLRLDLADKLAAHFGIVSTRRKAR